MKNIRRRNGKLQASIRRKGYKPIYRTFDDTVEGEQEAEQWVEDIEIQIKRGKHTDKNKTPWLRDALMRYMREVTPLKKPSGAKVEVNLILALCKIPLTDRRMDEIDSMLIATYRDELLADGYKASTINSRLATISRCYNVARTEWGVNADNPVKGVRRPTQNDARSRRLEGDEEQRLLEYLQSPYSDMVILLIETAMRRGELYALQWSDIKLNEQYLVLRETKNTESRSVPLSTRAVGIFKSLPRNISGKVFNGHPDTLSNKFKDACDDLDIQDLRIHDLRHEATSRLFELGVFDIMEIASITGHKDLKMLKRYTHFKASSLAARLG